MCLYSHMSYFILKSLLWVLYPAVVSEVCYSRAVVFCWRYNALHPYHALASLNWYFPRWWWYCILMMKGDVFWLTFMVFQSINWFQSLHFDGIYLEVERDFAMDFSYIVYYKPSPLFYSCLILIYSKDIQHVVSYSSPFLRGNFLNPPKW